METNHSRSIATTVLQQKQMNERSAGRYEWNTAILDSIAFSSEPKQSSPAETPPLDGKI